MGGFLSKFFGTGKKDSSPEQLVEQLVEEKLNGIINLAGLDLSFELDFIHAEEGNTVAINFEGTDAILLKDRKGILLDSIQLFIKRVLQHNFPDDKTNITVDCDGFKQENDAALIERAENLKNIAIDQSKAVYYRALPPKERKVVHQYLAKDPRVKSRSLGDGLYKKIKIFPAKVSASTDVSDEVPAE